MQNAMLYELNKLSTISDNLALGISEINDQIPGIEKKADGIRLEARDLQFLVKLNLVENEIDNALRNEIHNEIKIEPYMDNNEINDKLELMYLDNQDIYDAYDNVK